MLSAVYIFTFFTDHFNLRWNKLVSKLNLKGANKNSSSKSFSKGDLRTFVYI